MENVECKICGKKLKIINDFHLRHHNVSIDEYRKLYPNSALSIYLGKKHPMHNYNWTIKQRKQMSDANKKVVHTKEWNKNVSKAQKKRFKENPEAILRYVGNKNPACQPGIGEKISKKRKGHDVSKKTRDKIKKSLLGNKQSEETKRKKSISLSNVKRTKEWKENISKSLKHKWKNDKNYRKRQIKKMACGYNSLNGINAIEKKLLNILNKHFPNQWEFVGDGKFYVDTKCPDFKHKRKNLLIELYGNYWHRNDTEDDMQKRIDFFKQYDYDCLIIWENELDEETVFRRVNSV
jgi:hypothetical protein